MPLEKDYSIVADSTNSSPPRLDVDHDASPPIKRPTRTYGKHREQPPEPASNDSSGSTARTAVHNTAPPGLSAEIPGTSPRTQHEDESDMNERLAINLSKYGAWKAEMRQLDEEDAEHVAKTPSAECDDAPTDIISGFGRPSLLREATVTTPQKSVVSDIFDSPSLPSISNDIFGDNATEQTSSHGPPAKKAFALSSPQVAPTTRLRRFRNNSDLDSEDELSKPSSSNTPSSSSRPLHNINTPKSKSSYTSPPTSDDDMPTKIMAKGRTSGKSKKLSTRSSVPPLTLVEAPLSEFTDQSVRTQKRTKIKPPTKKDKQEMIKERSRLAAESNAIIPRETVAKYTKEYLLRAIAQGNKQPSASLDEAEPVVASDPIEAYSSPVNSRVAVDVTDAFHRVASSKVSQKQQSPDQLDSDSDDLPEVPNIFNEIAAKKKKQDLKDAKLRALEMQKRQAMKGSTNVDDDDLDIEIVRPNPRTGVKEEDERRRSPKKSHVSEARKQQLRLAQINPTRQRSARTAVHNVQTEPASGMLQHGGRMDQQALSRFMVSQAHKAARDVAVKKEEEWKKHGGRVTTRPENQAGQYAVVIQTIAGKGLETLKDSTSMDVEDENEDGSDEEWSPENRGSASPEPEENEREDDDEAEVEDDTNTTLDQDITMVGEDPEAIEEPKYRANHRVVITTDSEEENDENDENATPESGALFNRQVYRRATSSCEMPTDDEQDKENNTALMYDRSDDKENSAVVRHAPLSPFDSHEYPSPSQPSSMISRDWSARDQSMEDGRRKPFQELISDESPSSQSRTSTLTQSFAAKLQQSSQSTTMLTLTPTLKPFLGEGLPSEKSFSGFSQFSEGDSDPFGPVPLLQPSFTDLLVSGAEKQNKKPRNLDLSSDEAPSDENDLKTFKRTNTLQLTQDVNAVANLQPAFQGAESLMRKADVIFEKEQAFVLDAAFKKPSNQKPDLYVNDHGFLTQTRPAEGTPDIYRPSSSRKSNDIMHGAMISPSQSHARAPLRTLSVSSVYQPDSPEHLPLRRLRKNLTPPRDDSDLFRRLESPPSPPPPRQRNAFDMLAQGAAKVHRDKELRQRLPSAEVAAFLENEAAESDEDDTFGFGKSKKDDDEEEGEDLDGTLDVLMDDAAMDENTVAADLVLEKFKEQEEAQDQDLEKLHMAAIQGELRRKRTRGVGVDDSDEDSEDDGNARARRAMKKVRTTDRGDIKHLEANEATRSFAETYNQSLKDDDDEFLYLNKESHIDDVVAPRNDAEDSDDDEEEQEVQQTISHNELQRRVRQVAEAKTDVDDAAMDPEDLSWLDKGDDEEVMPRIKTVSARSRPQMRPRDQDVSELDGTMSGLLRKPSEPLNASSKQWFAQEHKSRNAGTSRSVGGSAITGHTKARPKTTKAPRTQSSESVSASTAGRKPMKAERSMLSTIVDKSRHFA